MSWIKRYCSICGKKMLAKGLCSIHYQQKWSKEKEWYPVYHIWTHIRGRCYNPKDFSYAGYGGRGIKLCDRWLDSKNFLGDMYPSYKKGLSIERINNNGPYSPENCVWADRFVQANNRRNNTKITYQGLTQGISQWSRQLDIKVTTIIERLRRGWSIEECFG